MREIIGRCCECDNEVDYEEDHLTADGECLCRFCKKIYEAAAYKLMYQTYEEQSPLMRKAIGLENVIGLLYKDIQDETEDL